LIQRYATIPPGMRLQLTCHLALKCISLADGDPLHNVEILESVEFE